MFPLAGKSHLKFEYSGSRMDVEATCPTCKEPELLNVSALGFSAWVGGKLTQDALPTLNDTQREQLMTGYCGPCWDEMWAEEDDGERAPTHTEAVARLDEVRSIVHNARGEEER